MYTRSGVYRILSSFLHAPMPYLRYLRIPFFYVPTYDTHHQLVGACVHEVTHLKKIQRPNFELSILKPRIGFLGCNSCQGRSRFLLQPQDDI